MKDKKRISKRLNKCILALDYAGKSFLVLSGAGTSVFLFSFTTVSGMKFGIVDDCISQVFLVTYRIINFFLKTIGRENFII